MADRFEPVIEIASQWGRFEWFARDALERGLKVGSYIQSIFFASW